MYILVQSLGNNKLDTTITNTQLMGEATGIMTGMKTMVNNMFVPDKWVDSLRDEWHTMTAIYEALLGFATLLQTSQGL